MREDWVEVELGSLSKYIIGGDWGKAPDYEDDNFEFAYCIRGAEFKNWQKDKGRTASLRKIKKNSTEKRELKVGDILIEISGGGPEQPVGRTVLISNSCLINLKKYKIVCTNFLRLFRPKEYVNSKWLNTYLIFFYHSGEVVKYQGGSNNLRNLKFRNYTTIKIPTAPLPEQRAIVSKIEQLFSELENGIANLKAAKDKLEIYRQAVLKKAFEGELTKEWREKNYSKDAKEEDLPEGWTWMKLEKLSDFITKGTTPKKDKLNNKNATIPFIKVYNLTHTGELDFSINPTFVDEETHKNFLRRSIVKPGDILMNIVGPPLGKVSIVPSGFDEWNINQAIVRYRPLDMLKPKYLMHYLLSYITINNISKKAKATVGQFNLTLEICRNTEIPLPTLPEQTQIVQKIETRLSVCDNILANIEEGLEKSEALRQSILKKAFEGKLLSEIELKACRKEPDWEPAEKLLKRIQGEKTEKQTVAKKATVRKFRTNQQS